MFKKKKRKGLNTFGVKHKHSRYVYGRAMLPCNKIEDFKTYNKDILCRIYLQKAPSMLYKKAAKEADGKNYNKNRFFLETIAHRIEADCPITITDWVLRYETFGGLEIWLGYIEEGDVPDAWEYFMKEVVYDILVNGNLQYNYEYIDFLENMTIMLSKEFMEFVKNSDEEFLKKVKLPRSTAICDAIMTISDETVVAHKKLDDEQMEAFVNEIVKKRSGDPFRYSTYSRVGHW